MKAIEGKKESIQKYFDIIGHGVAAVLLVVAVAGAFIYSWAYGVNLAVAMVSMIIGVFGAYYIFLSFEREEEPPALERGERRNLRTADIGVLIFPKKAGSRRSKEMHRNLSMYLTSRRIIARDQWGECFLDVPLKSLNYFRIEKIIATTYMRITYTQHGSEKEALLFVGNLKDVDLWTERLRKFGITDRTPTETIDESEMFDETKVKKEVKRG